MEKPSYPQYKILIARKKFFLCAIMGQKEERFNQERKYQLQMAEHFNPLKHFHAYDLILTSHNPMKHK